MLSNRNHQCKGLSAHGKRDFETKSRVTFIFPLSLCHSLLQDTQSFTTASSWSFFLQYSAAGTAVTSSAKCHYTSRGGECMGRTGLAMALGEMHLHSSGNGIRVPEALSTLLLCAHNVGPIHLASDYLTKLIELQVSQLRPPNTVSYWCKAALSSSVLS